MSLKVTLRPHERFWINGISLQNGNRKTFIIVHAFAEILTERHVVTKKESDISERHRIAYCWFLHHSGQHILDDTGCAELSVRTLSEFPELVRLIEQNKWFALYLAMLKLIRTKVEA